MINNVLFSFLRDNPGIYYISTVAQWQQHDYGVMESLPGGEINQLRLIDEETGRFERFPLTHAAANHPLMIILFKLDEGEAPYTDDVWKRRQLAEIEWSANVLRKELGDES